jgi:hypothetical protein
VPHMVSGWLHRRWLVSHDQSSITDSGLRLQRADFDHGGQLDQLGLVLVCVVLAEK